MDDYGRICDFSNLYAAHLKTRLGKRHKAEVIGFEVNLGYNLTLLSRMLQDDAYLPLHYYGFKVFEPKERDIHALRYPDRVVQRCLCDQVLLPAIEPRLLYDNAACRRHKGMHFSLDRLSKFMREHYRAFGNKGYVLKCDVYKYFKSISHQALLQKLGGLPLSGRMQAFIAGMIDSYHDVPGCGLPLGNQSSQWFALYYLDGVDRLVKEQLGIRGYVRYMDDFILLHPDKPYLTEARLRIEEYMRERLCLRLNSKTQLMPFRCGVDYLGFHLCPTGSGRILRRLLPAAKRRIKRSVRGLRDGMANGLLTADELRQGFASYKGHLGHADCQGLIHKLML